MFANTCAYAEDDLLDTSLDLTGFLAAKMKIALSLIPVSGSGDNIKEFMTKVDENVGLMSSLPNLSTLGQVLGLTKAIMDQVSKVVHLSSLTLIIINDSADRGD